MVNDNYINELIEKIKETQFIDENLCSGYDDGIKKLLGVFQEHKYLKSGVFFIGNGGSSAVANHMTADFMKNGGMCTHSLYDTAVITCMGNDYGYEYIFSKPMDFLVKENDLVIAISSSGNSKNIINAIEVAKSKKAKVITFTGFKPDNKAKQMGDFNIYVPCEKYGIVESIHTIILQQIVDMIFERDSEKLNTII